MNIKYRDAGVDITKGQQLVTSIKNIARAASNKSVINGIGGFSGLFSLNNEEYTQPVLVSSSDGVGTKLLIAQAVDKHDTIGIDLVAMCVNDLITQGAEPLFLLDYFATGKLDLAKAETIITGIVQGCKKANIALLGGETAEMPAMYSHNHYDLAGFAVGIVEHENILPKKKDIKVGDVVIGINSSGLHSNGFSLVRHLFEKHKISYTAPSLWPDKSWSEVLLTPTEIYVHVIAQLRDQVKAIAHITGGGIQDNISRVLPDHLTLLLHKLTLPQVFQYIADLGKITIQEMLRTFNCGIGMAVITEVVNVAQIKQIIENNQHTAIIIGEVMHRL